MSCLYLALPAVALSAPKNNFMGRGWQNLNLMDRGGIPSLKEVQVEVERAFDLRSGVGGEDVQFPST